MSVNPDDVELDRRQFNVLLAAALAVPAVLGRPETREGPPDRRPGRKHRVAFYASTAPS